MQLLKEAADFFSNKIHITIKTHPANPLLPGICNYIHHLKSYDSIAKLIMQCDIAYSSGATSAAVDAYCSGKPLISVLDPKILNLSPLRGKDSVYFIRNSQELIAAITEIVLLNQAPTNKNTFFTIDKQLPRWRKILSDNT
jgi:surface carbohydrate biosynthesis protein (TIGR04326 family)